MFSWKGFDKKSLVLRVFVKGLFCLDDKQKLVSNAKIKIIIEREKYKKKKKKKMMHMIFILVTPTLGYV